MKTRMVFMLGAGFAVWASTFFVLYAMLSVGCRFGWDEIELVAGLTLQRLQLVAILFINLIAGSTLVIVLRAGAGAPFLARAAYLAALVALGASVFNFAAVFWLSACN